MSRNFLPSFSKTHQLKTTNKFIPKNNNERKQHYYIIFWPLYLTIVIKITQQAMRSVYPLLCLCCHCRSGLLTSTQKFKITHSPKKETTKTYKHIIYNNTTHCLYYIFLHKFAYNTQIYGSVMSFICEIYNTDFLKILLFPFLAKRNCLLASVLLGYVIAVALVAFYTHTHMTHGKTIEWPLLEFI